MKPTPRSSAIAVEDSWRMSSGTTEKDRWSTQIDSRGAQIQGAIEGWLTGITMQQQILPTSDGIFAVKEEGHLNSSGRMVRKMISKMTIPVIPLNLNSAE